MPISKISQAGLDAPLSLTSPTLTTPNIDSAQIPTVSGTAPLYMCRAWVNFNGTGSVAIRASGNVTSITDNGTGDYTVNFTTAMTDANFAVVALGGNSTTAPGSASSSGVPVDNLSARVAFFNTAAVFSDRTFSSVAIFR